MTRDELYKLYQDSPLRYNSKHIKYAYPDIYNEIMSKKMGSWSENLYCYFHNIDERPRCPICGKYTKFVNVKLGYSKYCSVKCSSNDPIVRNKCMDTCMKKYGADNPIQSPKIRKKIEQSNMERYGAKYPFQSNQIQSKVRNNIKAKYGVYSALQNDEVKKKMINTNMKRYGVPCTSQNRNIQEKIKKSRHDNHIKDISDLLGYTEDGGWICKCPHPETCTKCKEKLYEIPATNYPSTIYWSRLHRNAEPCTKILPIQPLFSTRELQVRSWLDDLNIEYISNDRNLLNPQELDIYIPGNHLAIEINGSYWHSVDCKPKSYHMNKWTQCKEKGVKMITLWEDWIQDYQDECKQLIIYHLSMVDTINIPWDHNLVDLGLGSGSIKEHLSIHDGFECWDCGLFI